MKSFLKYCLVLLISICYFNSVFEFDSKECQQNYGKETHSYIISLKSTENSGIHAEKIVKVFTAFSALFFQEGTTEHPLLFSVFIEPNPPEKIYLRYRSLLI